MKKNKQPLWMKKKLEKEKEDSVDEAEKDRQAYLKRTGRKELKP